MLQLQTKTFDISRISQLLAKHNINASISNQVITLKDDISDEILEKLCKEITICSIQNFDNVVEKAHPDIVLAPSITKKYDLRYPIVKRGEVYLCDFGEPYGSEQGGKRYAIVVQNDMGNFYSPTTIVLSCTTEMTKKQLPVHHIFTFSDTNMLDYDLIRVSSEENIVMAEQFRTVDKIRLRKFLGTMTPDFMKKIQEIIDISLNLERPEKVLTRTEKVYINVPVGANTPNERKDVNMTQIQLLSLVDITSLLKISKSGDTDEIKAEKILELFGFDIQKNGVQYLLKAILISPKNSYFNLETLCEGIAKSALDIGKDEIKRLIVARIKEQLKFKKSPTIDFIRLVNCFLIKKEKKNEEDYI